MSWTLTSPEGHTSVELRLNSTGQLRYRILRNGRVLVRWSALGLVTETARFDDALTLVRSPAPRHHSEQIPMVHGPSSSLRVDATRADVRVRNHEGLEFEVRWHISESSVAFRYGLDAAFSPEADTIVITEELTTITLASQALGWVQPTEPVSSPAHENLYLHAIPAHTQSPTRSWELPATFSVADQWVLVAESDLDDGFHGSRLDGAAFQTYRLIGPDPAEGRGHGSELAVTSLPATLPWRCFAFADHAYQLLESRTVEELARPCVIEDTSWINPGRVAWSWWSQPSSPTDAQAQREAIDFAAEMGWEYVLIDANWDSMGAETIKNLVRHAASRDVRLMLWYNSGGPNNDVAEGPRDRLNTTESRLREFAQLAEWGIAGVKVDFFESEKQIQIQQYLGILRDAADHRLMVNFHGCTVPRGWNRTWPNLMTMESVRGAEWYLLPGSFSEDAPQHNTILPFTRNAVGSMDYTPVTFSDQRSPHLTTSAHELALSVVFHSSLLHFADSADSYRRQDPAVIDFLRDVPASWDSTVGLAGVPGEFVVVARRSGDEWWVAGICHQGKDAFELPVSALELDYPGTWAIISDGHTRDDVSVTSQPGHVELIAPSMAPAGGFIARWRPDSL